MPKGKTRSKGKNISKAKLTRKESLFGGYQVYEPKTHANRVWPSSISYKDSKRKYTFYEAFSTKKEANKRADWIRSRGIMPLVVISSVSLKDPSDNGSGKYAVYSGKTSPYFESKRFQT